MKKKKQLNLAGDFTSYYKDEVDPISDLNIRRMNRNTHLKFISDMKFACKIHKEQVKAILNDENFKFYRQILACTDKAILSFITITERYGYNEVNTYFVNLLDEKERKTGNYGGIR